MLGRCLSGLLFRYLYEADPVKNFLTLGFEDPLHRMLGPPLRRARRVE